MSRNLFGILKKLCGVPTGNEISKHTESPEDGASISDLPRMYTENNDSKDLPDGTGYKSCWAVIEGSTRQAIVDTLLQKDTEICDYYKGLEKTESAPYDDNAVIVTSDFNDSNYVIGLGLSKFFFNRDNLPGSFGAFPRVYLYMTHRVSECHGFALLENGKIIRLYEFSDAETNNIGKPLDVEKKLGYRLPNSMEEMLDHMDDDSVTDMDEEVIINIALEQTGINCLDYPYDNVVFGKLK